MLCSLVKGELNTSEVDPKLLKRIEDHFLNFLLKKQDLIELPTMEEAVSMAATREDLSKSILIRNILKTLGSLPPPYLCHMERFQNSFFITAFNKKKEFPICKDICPEISNAELCQIEKEVNEKLVMYFQPLNDFIFSVDDESTDEIDDAISAESIDEKQFRVGVHIAAPGVFIPENYATHNIACTYGTTVYQPDLKWTMLPRILIDMFSPKKGNTVPALSVYFICSTETFEILNVDFRLESITLRENFSYGALGEFLKGDFFPELNSDTQNPECIKKWLNTDPTQYPVMKNGIIQPGVDKAVDLLIPFCRHLFVNRHQNRLPTANRKEYRIKVFSDDDISIIERERNSIIEGIISELMILVNSHAAELLAKKSVPAIFRTKRLSCEETMKHWNRSYADLTVNPREHVDIGTSLYGWFSSPIRRYSDLVNQRQLGTLIGGHLPPFMDESELLIRAKKTELQIRIANSFQQRMERFWTLKYMENNKGQIWPVTIQRQEKKASVIFDHLPLRFSLPLDATIPPDGPALFTPEYIDFYSLKLDGKLSTV